MLSVIFSQSDSRGLPSSLAFYLLRLGRLSQRSPELTDAAPSASSLALGVPFSAFCLSSAGVPGGPPPPPSIYTGDRELNSSQLYGKPFIQAAWNLTLEARTLQPRSPEGKKDEEYLLVLAQPVLMTDFQSLPIQDVRVHNQVTGQSHISFWEHILATQPPIVLIQYFSASIYLFP